MANPDRAQGFVPVQYLNGSPWNGQTRLYSIAAAYATALYIGDPVISSGTSDTNGIPGVALGAATGALRGVITGLFDSGQTTAPVGGSFSGYSSNPDLVYRPALHANVWYAAVCDDPNVLFEIQEESVASQLTATEVGLNQISILNAGNGYVSGWELAGDTSGTAATTSTLQLRLMGLAQRPAGTNTFGAYAKWLVKINVHELAAAVAGV